MTQAQNRYRLMAYVVGVVLLVLVLVAMPLKYAAHSPTMVKVVGPAHGFLFIVYLLSVLDLARRVRWPLMKTLVVMVAGTVPFLSFVFERRVAHELALSPRRPVAEPGPEAAEARG